MPRIDPEILVLLLICGLLIVPRALQRFRIPAPLTCFAFGIWAGISAPQHAHDPTLMLLAALGISSLFLFAGLEVDLEAFARGRGMLLGHLAIRAVTIAAGTWAAMAALSMPWQAAILLTLAVLTPSTGFILDSLETLGLREEERFWIASKAITGELLALSLLFVVLQSDTSAQLARAGGALAALVVALPVGFLLLGRFVVRHAPGSEFSLLVLAGLLAAYVTKSLGAYYLVGAFLAGFSARMLRGRMPALASGDNMHAVKVFASFFMPFYFFSSGMKVPLEALDLKALAAGLGLAVLFLPGRIAFIYGQRRLFMHEDAASSLRVGLALTPTLIFTLVLATILRERYGIRDELFGGLLLYAAISTALPSIVLKRAAEFGAMDAAFGRADGEAGPPAPKREPPADNGREPARVQDPSGVPTGAGDR